MPSTKCMHKCRHSHIASNNPRLQGEPSPPRTTRIFVARIPPSVTEAQFRAYFEGFGKLQDAYMPKDHSKQVRLGPTCGGCDGGAGLG